MDSPAGFGSKAKLSLFTFEKFLFSSQQTIFFENLPFFPGGSLRPERGEKVPSAPVAASIQTTDGGTEGVEGGRWRKRGGGKLF